VSRGRRVKFCHLDSSRRNAVAGRTNLRLLARKESRNAGVRRKK
jgi:hypothetical protein